MSGNNNMLKDDEVVKALYAAGIPSLYHGKAKSLASISTPKWTEPDLLSKWADTEAKDFATLGKGIEIAFDGKPAYDHVYLLARKLQLIALPVSVVSLPLLKAAITTRHEVESAERLNEWNASTFLFIITSFSKDTAPYDRSAMFEMEWFLRSRILSGGSLCLQGDGLLNNSNWWSKGFLSLATESLALRISGPNHTTQK